MPRDVELARGPGNLAVALGASMGDDGSRLDSGAYHLDVAPAAAQGDLVRGLRVGVALPGGAHPFDWEVLAAGGALGLEVRSACLGAGE